MRKLLVNRQWMLNRDYVRLGWDGLEYGVLTAWLQVDLGIKHFGIELTKSTALEPRRLRILLARR